MYKYSDENLAVTIVEPSECVRYTTQEDIEMDERASQAVKSAIDKARVCKKPIAKYDIESGRAYLEYPDGRKEYV